MEGGIFWRDLSEGWASVKSPKRAPRLIQPNLGKLTKFDEIRPNSNNIDQIPRNLNELCKCGSISGSLTNLATVGQFGPSFTEHYQVYSNYVKIGRAWHLAQSGKGCPKLTKFGQICSTRGQVAQIRRNSGNTLEAWPELAKVVRKKLPTILTQRWQNLSENDQIWSTLAGSGRIESK